MTGYRNPNRGPDRMPSRAELEARSRRYNERRVQRNLRELQKIEVGGVPVSDWERMGQMIALYGDSWQNIDSMDTILRMIQGDAAIVKPSSITRNHLRVAMTMVALGRASR